MGRRAGAWQRVPDGHTRQEDRGLQVPTGSNSKQGCCGGKGRPNAHFTPLQVIRIIKFAIKEAKTAKLKDDDDEDEDDDDSDEGDNAGDGAADGGEEAKAETKPAPGASLKLMSRLGSRWLAKARLAAEPVKKGKKQKKRKKNKKKRGRSRSMLLAGLVLSLDLTAGTPEVDANFESFSGYALPRCLTPLNGTHISKPASGPNVTPRYTAMMRAAGRGELEVMEELHELGADVNLQNKAKSHTAATWAACQNQLPAIELLYQLGADLNVMTGSGARGHDRAAGLSAVGDVLS